ncbi:MAG: hypothetical protein WKF74_16395 [Pyrinomonadaceae bacterium]
MQKNFGERTVTLCAALLTALVACLILMSGCSGGGLGGKARPRTLADVPSEHLAFRFEPDVTEPPTAAAASTNEKLESVQRDFDIRRPDDALLRTIASPDGGRVLALYAAGDTLEGQFLIDLYTGDGQFLRKYMPSNLSGDFPSTLSWSPDGQAVAFIAHGNRSATSPQPTPSALNPTASPNAGAPLAPTVPAFSTEQIYVGDRDGFTVRPLTTRDGLIYFYFAWAPDSHALAALACKEDEWSERETEDKPPAGRPRLIFINGSERLLDDRLTDVLPVWSPDAAKVATAFETDVVIYDASLTNAPTGARITLADPLLAASVAYDEAKKTEGETANKNDSSKSGTTQTNSNATNGGGTTGGDSSSPPLSFNPVVRLQWPQAQTLFAQTGFVRIYRGGEIRSNYLRWHTLHLSPQAALLKIARRR